MITPYKDYQRRITDSDDEIDLEAICEPSGNDRMVAGKSPKVIFPHVTLTQEESGPNTVIPYFPVTRLAVACLSDAWAFLSSIFHKIASRHALGFNIIFIDVSAAFLSLPSPSCV